MIYKISIPNFEKYNERKDRPNYSWFKVHSKMFTDAKILGLNPTAKWTYLYLISVRSETSEHVFEVSRPMLELCVNSKGRHITSALNDLNDLGLISLENPAVRRPREEKKEKIREEKIPKARKVCVKNEQELPELLPQSAPSNLWNVYSERYQSRYRVKPVRNAMVNGQLKNFEKRLGKELAERVIEFYLNHNGSWYITQAHSVGAALRDAEKLATEFNSGRKITTLAARSAELTENNMQVLADYRKEQQDELRSIDSGNGGTISIQDDHADLEDVYSPTEEL